MILLLATLENLWDKVSTTPRKHLMELCSDDECCGWIWCYFHTKIHWFGKIFKRKFSDVTQCVTKFRNKLAVMWKMQRPWTFFTWRERAWNQQLQEGERDWPDTLPAGRSHVALFDVESSGLRRSSFSFLKLNQVLWTNWCLSLAMHGSKTHKLEKQLGLFRTCFSSACLW